MPDFPLKWALQNLVEMKLEIRCILLTEIPTFYGCFMDEEMIQ